MRLLRPVLLAALSLVLVPLSAVAPAHAATGTITGVALGPDGKPLPNVNWEIYELKDGSWQTYPFGPKLTDAKGRFSWNVPVGGRYRVCFSDSWYGQASSTSFWQPEVRHRDTCWPNATSHQTATTWTSTTAAPSKTFSVTLPRQGLGMAPVDPFFVGSFRTGEPITIVGQEGWRPTHATFTYQWMSQRDNALAAPIAGATSASFTPTPAQEGAWIFARVTASRAGYKPATLTTPTTKVGGTQHVQPTSPLQISGTASPGSTLTASFGKPASTYSEISWFVDGVPQPAATSYDAASSRFTVAAAHAGARIDARLKIYKKDAQGNYVDGSDAYQRAQVQVAGSRPVQALKAAPAPRGTATVGRTLYGPTGLTADPNATVSYQWVRGSTAISGATARTYTVRSADVNQRLKVRVTVRRPGWWNAYVSNSSTTVAKRALKPGTVKVVGTAKAGKSLKAKTAKWGPKPVRIRYQWQRNGKAIRGATKATYKLKKADRGKVVRVRITVSKSSHLTVAKVSKGRKVKR